MRTNSLVSAPLGLAALERDVVLHGDEHVLQARAARMMGMHVSRGDRADLECPRQVAERRVPAGIAAHVWALELDVEAIAPEGLGEAGGGVRALDAEPLARAAGEADEPLVQLGQEIWLEAGVEALAGVRGGQQAAEVRVAARGLDQEGQVRAVGEGDLGARNGADADRARRVGELERAVDAVVVGERERGIAELGGADRELLGQRRAVEEAVGGVRVQLDVFRPAHARLSTLSTSHPRAFQQ